MDPIQDTYLSRTLKRYSLLIISPMCCVSYQHRDWQSLTELDRYPKHYRSCTSPGHELLCANAPLFPHGELGFIISWHSCCMYGFQAQSGSWDDGIFWFADRILPLQQLTWMYKLYQSIYPDTVQLWLPTFNSGPNGSLCWYSIRTWTTPHSIEI